MQKKRILLVLSFATIISLIAGSCKHELPGSLVNQIPTGTSSDPCNPNNVYFEQQVLPMLVSNCAKSGCHDNASHKEGIVITSYTSVMSTVGVRAGNAGNSELYKVITTNNSGDRMPPPPALPLTQQQKNLVYDWIQQGAQNLICQNMCDSNVYTFSSSVKNIISNKCLGCHSGTSAGGGIDLSTYALIKAKVTDGKLWGSINQLPGYVAMPQNGSKLSVCEITQIKKWIDAGSPNN